MRKLYSSPAIGIAGILLFTLLFGRAIMAVDPYELPFGVYCTRDTLTVDDISILSDTLGFNFIYGISDSNTVPVLSQAGYDVIKWGDPDTLVHSPNKMSGYSYFKVEAEDRGSPIRFENWQGQSSGDFLVSSNNGNMIDNLWFGQYPKMHYLGQEGPKPFWAQVRLAIDPTDMTPDSLIGKILVYRFINNGWDTVAAIPVYPDSFLLAGDTVEAPSNPPLFRLCEGGPDTCAGDYKVKYSFWNSGKTTVYLDYFKSYDDIGQRIVETTQYDDSITAAVTGGWRDSVDYWWLRDEPRYDHFMPYGRVRDLVNDATGDLSSMTAYLLTSVRKSFDTTQMAIGLRSFLQLTGQDKVVINDYPFTGGVGRAFFTDYTGYNDDVHENDPASHRGLQKELELYSYKFFDVVAREVRDGTTLKEFWSSPQCFFQVGDSSQTFNPPNSMYYWRPLTQSEHRLNVYLPLCYGARGLAAWIYHFGQDGDDHGVNGGPSYSFGFYTGPGFQRNESMWEVFADDITPYIKAIDSVYLGLTWQRAYACSTGMPINPPAYAFVDSIAAVSNTSEANPDLGWFHVGEFVDDSACYAMIVNRACSQGPYDPTEAPSITATIRFNDDNIGGEHHYYIIDLAHSERHAGGDTGWVAIPETTYTAVMADGTIPFTTTFRAGEGRLFKIVQAAEKILHGTLDTNLVYQGKIKINGDLTVPSGGTFRVKGPASFNIGACDVMHSGRDTTAVEIICNGRLDFKGTETDSIFFAEFYDCGTLLVTPTPGIWYGIRDRSNGHDTLAYCAIKYAYEGFRADTNSNALLSHCEISNCEYCGVSLSYTNMNPTTVSSCLITKNGSIGIASKKSQFNADSNTITRNGNYGIYIKEKPSPFGEYGIYDNVITKGDSCSATRGIVMLGSASSQPAAVISGNVIKHFGESGVYLLRAATGEWAGPVGMRFSGSNVIDSNATNGIWCLYSSPAIYGGDALCQTNNNISNNIYGLYCTNSSSPKVTQAIFTSNQADVNCASASSPNLGDSVFFWGFNQLSATDFYFWNTTNPLIVTKAMGNWFSECPPQPLKFYPGTFAVNYRHYKNRRREPPCSGGLSPRIATSGLLPEQFALYQNYPNPFNPTTAIAFDLPQDSHVRVLIYNLLGQRIRTVANDDYAAGTHILHWDGRDETGSEVCSGVYFYVIETDSERAAKKMLMLR